MASGRRDFVKDLCAFGLLPAVAPGVATDAFAQQAAAAFEGAATDRAAYQFWSEFLDYRSTQVTWPPSSRGLTPSGGPAASGVDREPFFFHAGPSGLRPAIDIPAADLLPGGDVAVSVNVVAFRPSDDDRATFERLQSAQLRLDLVQERPVLDILETLAWTAIAALHPDRMSRLPPLENLSFDPSAGSQKMGSMLLPGGEGAWSVNLVAQKKESALSRFLTILTGEIDRFAPALGLPEISKVALGSFNKVYGALHQDAQSIFKMNPIQVFATSAAMGNRVSRGLPLRSGTYVLVPNQHVATLTPEEMDSVELKQGLLVPKNTPSMSLPEAAKSTFRNITYTTIDVVVKPAQVPNGCGGSGGGAPQRGAGTPQRGAAPPASAPPAQPPAQSAPAAPPAAPETPAPPSGRGRGRG